MLCCFSRCFVSRTFGYERIDNIKSVSQNDAVCVFCKEKFEEIYSRHYRFSYGTSPHFFHRGCFQRADGSCPFIGCQQSVHNATSQLFNRQIKDGFLS